MSGLANATAVLARRLMWRSTSNRAESRAGENFIIGSHSYCCSGGASVGRSRRYRNGAQGFIGAQRSVFKRLLAVLHMGPISGPVEAVRAAMVAEQRAKS